MVPFFDLDSVVAHTVAPDSALTTPRVGFLLEQHRESLMFDERHLAPPRHHAPRPARYFDARRIPGTLVPGWNLIVPDKPRGRAWAEGRRIIPSAALSGARQPSGYCAN